MGHPWKFLWGRRRSVDERDSSTWARVRSPGAQNDKSDLEFQILEVVAEGAAEVAAF